MAITTRADKYTVNSKLQTKFADFVSNLEVNPATGDLYRNINDFAIREALKNLILTENGERPFQPTIGTAIKNMLFENLTPQAILMMRQTIEIAISNHEPRVVLKDLSVVPDDEHNTVSVTLFYTTINSPGLIQDLTVTLLTRVR